MKKVLSISALSALTLTLSACSKPSVEFTAEGQVTGASGQTLYLDEVGTGNVLSLDSVQLDTEGRFIFKHEVSPYPMFYRLRLGQESIPFVADSTTHLIIQAQGDRFFSSYELKDAEIHNHQIKEIAHLRHSVDRRLDNIITQYNQGKLGVEELQTQLGTAITDLKKTLAERFIFTEPKSPVAYYALFQRKDGGALYFSPDEADDERAFAAVATAYELYYPNAPYTPFLKDMALRAVAQGRQRRSWGRAISEATANGERLTFPEIKLLDPKGIEQSLTKVVEEHPEGVLLSFTAYQADWSPDLVASLRKVQERNPSLTIYEVSVDSDSYYWKNATHQLPWLCVNDPTGRALLSYNIDKLPSFFLIKQGELHRISSLAEL